MKKLTHIAIADDHPTLATGLKLILNSFKNCKVVIEAYDGKDLIIQIREKEVKPDIIFLDISMPVLNGYEALVYIKKKWPQIKVIILSQHFNDYVVIKTIREGASACLPKEAEVAELQKAIEEVTNKGFYHSEHVLHSLVEITTGQNNVSKINAKEVTFLEYCCSDLSYNEIAKKMEVSPRTIDGYRDRLFEKLDLKSRSALVIYAIKSGIVDLKGL